MRADRTLPITLQSRQSGLRFEGRGRAGRSIPSECREAVVHGRRHHIASMPVSSCQGYMPPVVTR